LRDVKAASYSLRGAISQRSLQLKIRPAVFDFYLVLELATHGHLMRLHSYDRGFLESY
jgi:hypothetical protein